MLQSGQFSSTIKTSLTISSVDTDGRGISYTGADTLFTGFGGKLFVLSGQFTTTVVDSEDISAIDTESQGIETTDLNGRLGISVAPPASRFFIKYPNIF